IGVTTTTKTTTPVAHPSASSFTTVKSDEEAQVSLVVNPGATIAGKVLDAQGKPVPGACVMAGVAKRDKSGLSFVLGPRGFADRDGAYRLQVAPGEYVLRVKPDMKFSTFFYYASGMDLEKATIVPIEAGDRVVGIDIHVP
ncbi:MAG TPA: carboxypeptidase-like regulatory domain-containing protein, partial [Terriglobia bacterium]|nr:carboxypeptidase-like regulatory domain-containing protein [Terriglobia bacterium]